MGITLIKAKGKRQNANGKGGERLKEKGEKGEVK
jgi:hypothetical protein